MAANSNSRVLLIDDDEMELKLVEAHLQHATNNKTQLDYADSMEAATKLLEKQSYKSIILDNRMHPYRDFTETAPMIQSHLEKTHCVVISSVADDPCFSKIKDYNVDEVIDKFDLPNRIKDGLFS